MKHLIFLVLGFLAFTTTMNAQGFEKPDRNRISIEIDPATFAFGGYSAHLRIQPKGNQHLLLGLGTYAMDMPSFLVDLNAENKGENWDVRIRQAYGLFGEHHFSEVNRKWFIGAQAGVQAFRVEKESVEGKGEFTNLLLMGYGGYTWKPFDNPFYIKTWAGMGYTAKMSGENRLGKEEYDVSPITMFVTVHLGWSF
jgi:hypothetical protein